MTSFQMKTVALVCLLVAYTAAIPIASYSPAARRNNATLPYIHAANPIQKFQKICVTNDAGFVLHWWMRDLIQGTQSQDSGPYP